jgi:hypothetical protein
MDMRQQTRKPVGSVQGRLFRFALVLWAVVGVVALLVPWPYALVAVLFATFLHFAALDGDAPTRQFARRKS